MKKTLFTLAALMCMTLGLTACGDDNDDPETIVSGSATYEVEFSQDLLDAADISIVYVGDNGQVSLDKATSTRWTRKVTRQLKNVPSDYGFKLVFTVKSNLNKESYQLKAEGTIKGETPTSTRVFTKTLLNTPVGPDKVQEILNKNNNKAFGIQIYKDGTIIENPLFTVFI